MVISATVQDLEIQQCGCRRYGDLGVQQKYFLTCFVECVTGRLFVVYMPCNGDR